MGYRTPHLKRSHSADRTRSWRARAGSRRNKRLRNVGTHKGERHGSHAG